MARRKQKQQPQPGWAIYLRTSDEEAQNPESSQSRQRYLIDRAVLERSDLPVIEVYKDVLTGKTPHRKDYQRMLEDARQGKFSHVVVERADRFGRNDTEALRAIDELDEMGIAVRFANQPDLDPMSPDDRVIVALSFTLARRESMMTSLRIRGAIDAKRQAGGFVGREPDGFISLEEDRPNRKNYARRAHYITQDPQRAHIWREAWDLLLEDRMPMSQIAEELHARGYRHRSGRPFIEIKANGQRFAVTNTMWASFHNWTYAGWIVADGIPPKTLRGNWEPIVTTEEFEQGMRILKRRSLHRLPKRKHDYFLKGLVFLSASPDDPTQPGTHLYRLTCSTSNTARPGGGTAHYRLQKHPIHFICSDIDEQFADHMARVNVDDAILPTIREYYIREVANKLGQLRPDERAELERRLKKIDEEEARGLRLYVEGLVTEENWRRLWGEWQDRRHKLHNNLNLIEEKCETHIQNLDDALTIISKMGILYKHLSDSQRKELLRNMVERVVVSLEGEIERLDLYPPFAYLRHVSEIVKGCERPSQTAPENETGGLEATCSSDFLDCGSTRTRLEPFSASEHTLQFTVIIAFPQGKKLKHLSLEPAIR